MISYNETRTLPDQFVHALRRRIAEIEYNYEALRPMLLAALAEIEAISADTAVDETERVNRISDALDRYDIPLK